MRCKGAKGSSPQSSCMHHTTVNHFSISLYINTYTIFFFFCSLLLLYSYPFSWLSPFLQNLFQRFITPCIDYITEGLDDSRKQTALNTVICQTSLNMLTQFCHVFDAMYPVSPSAAIDDVDVDAAADDDEQRSHDIIECGFIEVKIALLIKIN